MEDHPTNPKILKLREQWRNANARRRNGTQLPMAEYRAKIAAASADHQSKRRLEREAATAARREHRLREAAELREANKSERQAKQKALQKAWREANRDRMRELVRAWKLRNPDKRSADRKSRKNRKLQTVRRELLKLQKGRCAYCRVKLGTGFHVDHITALSRGGPDKRSNLQLACAPCNLAKSARHPIEFAQSLGRLL